MLAKALAVRKSWIQARLKNTEKDALLIVYKLLNTKLYHIKLLLYNSHSISTNLLL